MEYPSPNLCQRAFDTLSILAMSTEIERVFSSAKRTIPVDRNSLANEAFEAQQCMKQLDKKLANDVIGRKNVVPESIERRLMSRSRSRVSRLLAALGWGPARFTPAEELHFI